MFEVALSEIQEGQKISHWIWFVLPQLKSLGQSSTALHYGVESLEEAQNLLEDPIFNERLGKIVLEIHNKIFSHGLPINYLMGSEIDALKTSSSLTLFEVAGFSHGKQVLDRIGRCERTLSYLK